MPFVCKPKEIKNKLCELIFQFNDSSLAVTVLSCKEQRTKAWVLKLAVLDRKTMEMSIWQYFNELDCKTFKSPLKDSRLCENKPVNVNYLSVPN